jgi:hypothetical protein
MKQIKTSPIFRNCFSNGTFALDTLVSSTLSGVDVTASLTSLVLPLAVCPFLLPSAPHVNTFANSVFLLLVLPRKWILHTQGFSNATNSILVISSNLVISSLVINMKAAHPVMSSVFTGLIVFHHEILWWFSLH